MKIDDVSRFCVLGPGRLGSTLVVNLERAGFVVGAVSGRAGGAADPAAHPPRLSLTDALTGADVVWLAVPDDRIAEVARDVAGVLDSRGAADRPTLAIHSSGLGSLALLDALDEAGLATLCVHPLQTFAAGKPAADALVGVPCAVTAGDEATGAFGADLVACLGGVPFGLADDAKPLYHLAAAIASNLFVALESEAATLLAAATGGSHGGSLGLLGPLVAATARNLAAGDAGRALTGPVARGDVSTVRAHLALLDERAPHFGATYRALSREALSLAAPRLDDEAVRTLQTLLADPEAS